MLNQSEILKLIEENKLIENYVDLGVQLTPNGFDLTAADIFGFDGAGAMDFSNKERLIPEGHEIMPKKKTGQDIFGWWNLKKGAYKVITNEIVNLPNDLTAIAFPRSSLLRMGAFTQTGVWDAGFKGRSEFILVVENPNGIKLKQNVRIAQLIFMKINEASKGYDGIYQGK
jgi:dUTP pyrophosphatase